MVDIQSPTAEIRRGKKKKKEERRRNRMKTYMVSLLHRATIIKLEAKDVLANKPHAGCRKGRKMKFFVHGDLDL